MPFILASFHFPLAVGLISIGAPSAHGTSDGDGRGSRRDDRARNGTARKFPGWRGPRRDSSGVSVKFLVCDRAILSRVQETAPMTMIGRIHRRSEGIPSTFVRAFTVARIVVVTALEQGLETRLEVLEERSSNQEVRNPLWIPIPQSIIVTDPVPRGKVFLAGGRCHGRSPVPVPRVSTSALVGFPRRLPGTCPPR